MQEHINHIFISFMPDSKDFQPWLKHQRNLGDMFENVFNVSEFPQWCRFSEMFDWTTHAGYLYMPAWVREIGAMMQLLPLLLVPFVGVVQSFRYFLNGHGPLHEVRSKNSLE